MISQETKTLKNRIKKFNDDVMLSGAPAELGLISVFMDSKDNQRRAIIITEASGDTGQVRNLAAKYFEGVPYKVIFREGYPESTDLLLSGEGCRHDSSSDWGTLGGFFRRPSESVIYGLSNNHVIARLNQGKIGDIVRYKGNVAAGTLADFVRIKPYPTPNSIDAGIFQLDPSNSRRWSPYKPRGIYGPRLHLGVYKKGAASEMTKGIVMGYNGTTDVIMQGRKFKFTNVIAIKGSKGHFSGPGDSGALVLTNNHLAVGIIFAKFESYSYALPISLLMKALKNCCWLI